MSHSFPRRQFLAGAAAAAGAAAIATEHLAAAIPYVIPTALTHEMPQAGPLHREDFLLELSRETDPFRRAAIDGDVRAVEQFLSKDPALLYARDALGQSVYLLAAYAGRAEILTLLESKGLQLDVYEAMAGGKVERANQLLQPAPGLIRAASPAGDTPIHVATLADRPEMIDNTILYGPNNTLRNPKRKNATAAHIAMQSPREAAAEAMAFAMVGNGLDPNLATSDGDALLHCAARTGYPRVLRLLIQKGADVSARNAAGQTAHDIATAAGKSDAIALLHNANLIPRDYYARRFAYDTKFAALKRDDTQGLPRDLINNFIAVCHFSLDRVKQLIALCPDLLNTRATWDELPVEAAAHMGRTDIGGIFLDRGASYSLPTATVFGSLDEVKRLLADDPQRIHERGAHSFPVLWYTAFGKPKRDAAEYLISKGADLREDMRGQTVLHVAARSGHLELCRYFLEQGLDPLQKGSSFLGTQDAAEAAEQSKHPEVAAMLRDWSKQHPSR
jgi:ankyrin repeat protein